MTDDKKQKVLIGVLAVLILGAGGYYFVFRDSGGNTGPQVEQAQVERKQRTAAPVETNKRTARRETAPQDAEPVAERQTREVEERATRTRERRKSGGIERKKEKKLTPAA